MKPGQFLDRHPLLKGLGSSDAASLLRRSVTRAYPARAAVFLRGDEADGVYGILDGSVVVTVESSDGGDLILRLMGQGQLFGELAVVDGRGRTASVITRTPCSFLFIPRAAFRDMLAAHPEVSAAIMSTFADYLRRTTKVVSEAVFLDVAHRLARLLVELRGSFATGEDPCAGIQVSQYELARMLGVSREIVNHHLAGWRRSGLVEVSRGRIRLLDDRAMAALARETR